VKRWVAFSTATALSGCVSTPLGYLEGSGSTSGDLLQSLARGFLAISVAVVLIIAVLIVVATQRARGRAARSAPGDIGREGGGVSAIYWGVGLSIPVLIAMAVWTFVSVQAVATPPQEPALAVTITGHRWWWDIDYQSAQPSGNLRTANELVVPTGVPVRLDLRSADVIHDFWVPKLGPKMDMIPGRTNHSWIEADRPGTYRGQCAEFCGVQHGRMSFVVRAVPPAEFKAWLNHQRQAVNASGPAQEIFEAKCGACHEVRGTSAAGIFGPDLTHVGSRTILAAMMPNTSHNLALWLGDTQGVKPGTEMPQTKLNPVERAQLVGWLETLK